MPVLKILVDQTEMSWTTEVDQSPPLEMRRKWPPLQERGSQPRKELLSAPRSGCYFWEKMEKWRLGNHLPRWFLFLYNSLIVQLLSRVQLFATPWTAASLSLTVSWSLPKFMSIELVMPSNSLILCCPLLLLLSIFPSIRVFSNELALRIRWPKYWNFNFNISPSNEHSGLISFGMDWLDLLAVQGTQHLC